MTGQALNAAALKEQRSGLDQRSSCQLGLDVASEAAARPAQVQQLVEALQPSCQVLEAAEKLLQRLAQDQAPDPGRAKALAALLPLEHLLQGSPLMYLALLHALLQPRS